MSLNESTPGAPRSAQWFYVFSVGLRPEPPHLSGHLGGASQGPMFLRILLRPSARAARPLWGSRGGASQGPVGMYSLQAFGTSARAAVTWGSRGGIHEAWGEKKKIGMPALVACAAADVARMALCHMYVARFCSYGLGHFDTATFACMPQPFVLKWHLRIFAFTSLRIFLLTLHFTYHLILLFAYGRRVGHQR